MYERRMAPGSCVEHGAWRQSMEVSHWSGKSALTIRLWSGETSDIAPFDSFHRFHQCGHIRFHQIAAEENRLRLTTFQLLFSLYRHAWLGLAYQGIVSPLGHEDMAFSCFCGYMLRNSRELTYLACSHIE